MAHDRAIGSHLVQHRGELMTMRLRGPLTELDVLGMQATVRAVRDEQGRCFLLAAVTGLTGIDADARRAMVQWGRSHPEDRVAGVAVHGVSFPMRTLITLTVNAVRLMGFSEVVLKFTRDEPDSLSWIDEQRAALDSETEAAQ